MYGEVIDIKILTDESREPTGNAVVFYRSRDSAMDAITKLHQAYKIREGEQHPISVSWAVRGRGPSPIRVPPATPRPVAHWATRAPPATIIAQEPAPPRPRIKRKTSA